MIIDHFPLFPTFQNDWRNQSTEKTHHLQRNFEGQRRGQGQGRHGQNKDVLGPFGYRMDQSLLKEWMEMGALLMLLLQKPMWARSSLTYPYNTTNHLTFFFFPLLVIGSPKQKPSKDRAAVERHFQRTDITHLLRHRVRGSVDVAFFFRGPFFFFFFASHSFTHGSSSLFRFVLIFFDWCIHESFDAPELTLMLIYYLEFR